MGFWDRMKAAVARKPRKGTGLELSRWTAAPQRRGTRELLVAYREQPVLRSVAEKVSDNVACVTWRVYRRQDPKTGKGLKDTPLRTASGPERRMMVKALLRSKEAVEVPNHPLLDLLANPNDYLTGRAITKLQQTHLDIVGDAFLLLERGPGGSVVGYWPLPPSWVTQLPNLADPREKRTYAVTIASVSRAIPAADIIHLSNPDPDDPLGRGVGAGFTLGDELDSDEYAARFVKNYFWNQALPASVVSIEGLNDANSGPAKAFKEDLIRNHGGAEKQGKFLLTNGKVSIARLDTSFKDMNLVELRKFLHGFVRMHYGIPPEIIGDISSSNRATAQAAREIFAEQVIVPRLEFLRSELQMRLVPLFGEDIVLDYDSPVPADRDHQLAVMSKMPEAFSYDEWRELAGFRPDPNRKGYPLPMPGQKPEQQVDDETEPDEGEDTPEEDSVEEEKATRADPPWASKPL